MNECSNDGCIKRPFGGGRCKQHFREKVETLSDEKVETLSDTPSVQDIDFSFGDVTGSDDVFDDVSDDLFED